MITYNIVQPIIPNRYLAQMNVHTMQKILFIFFTGLFFLSPQLSSAQNKTTKPAPKNTTGSLSNSTNTRDYFVDIVTNMGNIRVKLYNETPIHRDNFIKLVKSGFYDSLLFHRVVPGYMVQSGDPDSKRISKDSLLGANDVGYKLPAEIKPGLYHKRGALAMARNQNPLKESSGSQFYIVSGQKNYTVKEIQTMANNINAQKKLRLFQEIMKTDTVKKRLDDFSLRGDSKGLELYMKEIQPVIDSIFEPMFFEPNSEYINLYMQYGGAPHLDREYTVFGEVILGQNIVDRMTEVAVDPNYKPQKDIRIIQVYLVN